MATYQYFWQNYNMSHGSRSDIISDFACRATVLCMAAKVKVRYGYNKTQINMCE